MKTILTAACLAAMFAAGPASATPTDSRPATGEGTVFDDLSALGFDLGKFRPDYAGRFPYR
jgi:hypothetical protein